MESTTLTPNNVNPRFAFLDLSVEVVLAGRLPDGSSPKAKLQQLQPLRWAAAGRSLPRPSKQNAETSEMEYDDEQITEYHDWRRKIIAQTLTHLWVADPFDASVLYWYPVKVVATVSDTGAGELTIDDFDKRDNIARCVDALVADLNDGGPMAQVKGQAFRPE